MIDTYYPEEVDEWDTVTPEPKPAPKPALKPEPRKLSYREMRKIGYDAGVRDEWIDTFVTYLKYAGDVKDEQQRIIEQLRNNQRQIFKPANKPAKKRF